jgi:hypothetical protein
MPDPDSKLWPNPDRKLWPDPDPEQMLIGMLDQRKNPNRNDNEM